MTLLPSFLNLFSKTRVYVRKTGLVRNLIGICRRSLWFVFTSHNALFTKAFVVVETVFCAENSVIKKRSSFSELYLQL